MAADESHEEPFDPRQEPEFPPTDESGDVDLSLIRYMLSLTPAQRLEKVGSARLLAQCLREAGEKIYGPARTAHQTAD